MLFPVHTPPPPATALDGVILAVAVGAAAGYGSLYRAANAHGKQPSRARAIAFGFGILLLIVVGASPLDAAATRSLFAHMIEHLVLTDGIPPLILLGAPFSLAVAILPVESRHAIFRFARRPLVRAALHPAVGLLVFVAAIWAIHLSPFFDAALRYAPLHLAEQAAFLIAGFALWAPVFARRGHPWMLPFFVRLAYLFASMPAIAFLGFVLYETNAPLYPAYTAAGNGLADQRNGAELMWVGGSLLMFAAFMVGLAAWARREMRTDRNVTEPAR